jgi:hypothetical protein
MLSEYEEQCLLVEYLELKHLQFSKVAQETFTSNWGIVMKNKKSGVRKGIPDMMIIFPPRETKYYRLVFIEMKKEKGGVLSPEQKDWLDKLNQCKDVYGFVCNGFKEAKKIIDSLV